MNKQGHQLENGEVEIFNEQNVMLWKGVIRNGKKWNGRGVFKWMDDKDNVWECDG